MDTHTFLRSVARRQDGVVTHGQALAAGVPEHEIGTLRLTGRWLSPADRVYQIDAALEVSRRGRIRAAVLSLGPGAVAVLGTAAELLEMGGLPASDEIWVAVPAPSAAARGGLRPSRVRGPAAAAAPSSGARQGVVTDTAQGIRGPRARPVAGPHHPGRPRIRVLRGRLAAHEIHAVAGIPVSSPVRTAADLLLRLPRYPAVALLDAALHHGLLTTAALAAVPAMIRGRAGAAAARRHLAEADGRAHSPLATRVRLRCADGGVAPDDLQHVVRDPDGHILAVADLAWPGHAVLAEADGAGPPGAPRAVHEDRRRQNNLADAGWRALRFAWADTLRAEYIPCVVRSALSRPVPSITAAGR